MPSTPASAIVPLQLGLIADDEERAFPDSPTGVRKVDPVFERYPKPGAALSVMSRNKQATSHTVAGVRAAPRDHGTIGPLETVPSHNANGHRDRAGLQPARRTSNGTILRSTAHPVSWLSGWDATGSEPERHPVLSHRMPVVLFVGVSGFDQPLLPEVRSVSGELFERSVGRYERIWGHAGNVAGFSISIGLLQ